MDVAKVISKLKGLLIQVHWGRRLTFPVFVPDVARACIAALQSGRPGEVYNVSGDSLTHTAVNRVVSRLAGLPAFRLNVPAAAMLALARWSTRRAERTGREPYYPVNLASYVFHDWPVSSAKAQVEFAFVPTRFEDGAQRISGSIPIATPIKVNAPVASASMAVQWRRPITLTEVARSGNSKPSPVGEKGNPSITSAPDFGMTCHRMYQ